MKKPVSPRFHVLRLCKLHFTCYSLVDRTLCGHQQPLTLCYNVLFSLSATRPNYKVLQCMVFQVPKIKWKCCSKRTWVAFPLIGGGYVFKDKNIVHLR